MLRVPTLGLLVAWTALGATAATNKKGELELRGKINYGAARFRFLQVSLTSVDGGFTKATLTDPGGEFRFNHLPAGSYALTVVRRGLGLIRRSVVITPGLADPKGVVRIDIPFSPAEAAMSRTAGLISKQQLAVPDKAHGKYAEAERKLAKRDTAGAERLFEEALAIAPKYMAAWNFLGVLSYQRRDYEKAREYFDHAVTVEPTAYEPMVNLGGVMLALRKPEESLVYNLKAVDLRPRDALAQAQTGLAYFNLGQYEKAEPYLRAAKQIDPSHVSQPQMFLAEIDIRRGDRAAAAGELQDLLTRRPDGALAEDLRRRIRRLQAPRNRAAGDNQGR